MKKESTASRLKQLMAEQGLRQVDILERTLPVCSRYDVKMNKSDISQYVAGKVEPNQDKLFALALALNVSEGWLMGFDVPKERFTGASKTLTLVPAKSASAPQHAPDLPPDEQRLLDIYRDLSDDGKAVLLNYADDMSHLGKYKKRTPDERQSLAKNHAQDEIGGKQ